MGGLLPELAARGEGVPVRSVVRLRFAVPWAVIALVTLVGCSSATPSSAPSTVAPGTTFKGATTVAPIGDVELATAVAPPFDADPPTTDRPAADTMDSSQERILDDNEVTFAEYESAVLATLACLEEGGFRTSEPKTARAGLILSWTFIPPAGLADEDVEAIESSCTVRYLEPVQSFYIDSVRPDERTQAEFEYKLWECLVEAGMALPEGLTEPELVEATISETDVPASEMHSCLEQFAPGVVFAG